ncbi:putative non-specific serine/threonine protein kinase [Dioscorea sansibarensis]
MFFDDQTYSIIGRGFFNVLFKLCFTGLRNSFLCLLHAHIYELCVYGKKVLRDFSTAKEANGTSWAIVKSFNTMVNSNTMEIHLLLAGQGTVNIPRWGVYGPLISATSVTPNFKLDTAENYELSKGTTLGIVAAGCVNFEIWTQTGIFTLRQIKADTRNFDPANKLGESGFGTVYQGVLADGSLIAVKQLSS